MKGDVRNVREQRRSFEGMSEGMSGRLLCLFFNVLRVLVVSVPRDKSLPVATMLNKERFRFQALLQRCEALFNDTNEFVQCKSIALSQRCRKSGPQEASTLKKKK